MRQPSMRVDRYSGKCYGAFHARDEDSNLSVSHLGCFRERPIRRGRRQRRDRESRLLRLLSGRIRFPRLSFCRLYICNSIMQIMGPRSIGKIRRNVRAIAILNAVMNTSLAYTYLRGGAPIPALPLPRPLPVDRKPLCEDAAVR